MLVFYESMLHSGQVSVWPLTIKSVKHSFGGMVVNGGSGWVCESIKGPQVQSSSGLGDVALV